MHCIKVWCTQEQVRKCLIVGHVFTLEDPLERDKDVYDHLVAEWQAWNASMLPEIAESFTRSLIDDELGDPYGSQNANPAPDPTLPLPSGRAVAVTVISC